MQKDLVLIVAGPTASGKSQLAMDLASRLSGVVINADSMQMYKDTPILSAMPSNEDMETVPHKLFGVLSSSKRGSVAGWLDLAVREIKKTWKDGKLPIVAGGTGMYIDALINGVSPIPEVEAKIGEKFEHDGLREFDIESYKKLKPGDTTRIRRAYEVFAATGIAISEWHKKPLVKKLPEAEFLAVKILPLKKDLEEKISKRLDMMLEQGALTEVLRLMEKDLASDLPAMKALGVPEFSAYLRDEVSREKALELAKVHTNQYAKRQITWFKHKLKADVILQKCYSRAEESVLKKIIDVAQKGVKL